MKYVTANWDCDACLLNIKQKKILETFVTNSQAFKHFING